MSLRRRVCDCCGTNIAKIDNSIKLVQRVKDENKVGHFKMNGVGDLCEGCFKAITTQDLAYLNDKCYKDV